MTGVTQFESGTAGPAVLSVRYGRADDGI